MKRKLFSVLLIFTIFNTACWAQGTDPDWFFLKENDSLVFIPLPKSVNTNANERTPIVIGNMLFFNSDRKNLSGDEAALSKNENLYTAQMKGEGNWTNVEKNYFWNSDDHTVIVGANESNIFLYKTFGEGNIYISSFETKGWTNPKKMKAPVNSEEHEQSIACENGIMIISSERTGSLGEHDLFWCRTSTEGNIGELKPFAFNTSADEIDVSLSPDGRTLYFSSDQNNGQYDIFTSVFEHGTWQQPICLPSPINIPTANDGGFRNCDSVFYMHSDRNGSYDLFEGYTFPRKTSVDSILKTNEMLLSFSTEHLFVHKTVTDSLPANVNSKSSITVNIEMHKDHFDQLENYMDSIGIVEYYARVQIGAWNGSSIESFKKMYPSLRDTAIIIRAEKTTKGNILDRFLIEEKFYTLKKASSMQTDMVEKHNIKDAFVAVYNKQDERIAIFNVYTGNFVLLSGDKIPVKF
jgi:hypothetical protein